MPDVVMPKWLPISTAPRDGTYILLAGDSGYRGTPLRVEVGRYAPKFRPLSPWQTHSNDAFTDGGPPPMFWLPLPPEPEKIKAEKAPVTDEEKVALLQRKLNAGSIIYIKLPGHELEHVVKGVRLEKGVQVFCASDWNNIHDAVPRLWNRANIAEPLAYLW